MQRQHTLEGSVNYLTLSQETVMLAIVEFQIWLELTIFFCDVQLYWELGMINQCVYLFLTANDMPKYCINIHRSPDAFIMYYIKQYKQ